MLDRHFSQIGGNAVDKGDNDHVNRAAFPQNCLKRLQYSMPAHFYIKQIRPQCDKQYTDNAVLMQPFAKDDI